MILGTSKNKELFMFLKKEQLRTIKWGTMSYS